MTRILALANRATAAYQEMRKPDHRIDFEKWDKDNNEMESEMYAIDKAAGPGLCVGRVISFGVADGSASYIITKVRANDVCVEWIPLGDHYFSQAVGLSRDKTEHVVNRHTAESYCRLHDSFAKEVATKTSEVPA